MAKAKENTASGSAEFAPEGVETTEQSLTVAIDHTEQIKSLEAGLKEALKEIAALNKKLEAHVDSAPAAPVVSGQKDQKQQILDRAAVIAGQIASGSVIEGLLQGNHATTISLSSIRVAVMLERVAEKIEACPELLTIKITDAHDKLEAIIRAENAEQVAKSAE